MLHIVIFGPPGSGKGTQSKRITEKYGLTHISTGDILRREMLMGTELGDIAHKYINQGRLVPDDVIIAMLKEELNDIEHHSGGIVFDGFPRTVEQAKALKKILAEKDQEIAIMLNLEVDKEELTNRLIKRSETSGRADDNPETIKFRLQLYDDITAPVIEFYKNEGHYKGVTNAGSVEEIFHEIETIIDSALKMSAE